MKELKTILIFSIFIPLVLLISAIVYLQRSSKIENNVNGRVADDIKKSIMNMKISSSAFEHNSTIPSKYTCDGENINPALQISGVPENAKSLVLIVDDPDATRGWTWLHWTIWNINPETKEIAENSFPEGAIEGKTDFGRTGYGGPCPPSNVHRYFFKLFALDAVLNLASGASLAELQKSLEGHILTQAELIGLYGRK